MIYTIAFDNQKGGVAKTTTCCNTAVGLAKAGKKVLVIDLDPQGSATKAFLPNEDLEEGNAVPFVDYDKCIEDCMLDPSVTRECISHTHFGVDIIPSTKTPDILEKMRTDIMSVSYPVAQYRLKKVIREVRHDYDYCLIDCAPTCDMLTMNACAAANLVVAPMTPSKKSIESFAATRKQINAAREELDADVHWKILITMVNRTLNDREYVKELEELFADECFNTQIRYQSKPITKADKHGSFVILDTDIDSKVASDYREFVNELMEAKESYDL